MYTRSFSDATVRCCGSCASSSSGVGCRHSPAPRTANNDTQSGGGPRVPPRSSASTLRGARRVTLIDQTAEEAHAEKAIPSPSPAC